MDKRSKILASVFGLMIAYGLVSKVIYPTWIAPMVTIDDRIADRQAELDKLEAIVAEAEQARYEYREWAGRTGGFEADSTVTELREHLNKILKARKLVDVKVTPTRPTDDNKTKLWKATVTVSAAGGLESVVAFLQDMAELPQVCRVGNASISPARVHGKNTTINRFNFRVPVEVWIVPQQQLVGRLEKDDLIHPDFFIRHQGRDYASIWKGDPFNPYVEMRVKTKPTLTVLKGKKATLDATVQGGVGPYRYQWTPPEGLAAPKTRSPRLDSSKVGRVVYSVTVTDARGKVGNSSISVTVSDPPPPPVRTTQTAATKSPPVVVAKGRSIAKDARFQTLTMVMMRESANDHRDEIMVNHSRSKTTEYFAAGDEFEGGQLIFVHQSGGLVNWKDEYFVYPLGDTLDHFVSAKDAFDYPVLQRAAGKHMDLMKEMTERDAEKKKAETQVPKKPGANTAVAGKNSPATGTPENAGPATTQPATKASTILPKRTAKANSPTNAEKSPPRDAGKSPAAKTGASLAKKQTSKASGNKPSRATGKKRPSRRRRK